MIRLLLIVTLVLVILAFKFLPWWALIGLAVLFFLSLKFLGGWLFGKLLALPFKAKGAVLKNAQAEVHSITRAPAPEPKKAAAEMSSAGGEESEQGEEEDELDEEEGVERQYYLLEVTITPRASSGSFTHWEPGELLLVLPETKPVDSDNACSIRQIEIHEDGNYKPDTGYKFAGPLRLRMLLGVKPEIRRLRFKYYFEIFGEVQIP